MEETMLVLVDTINNNNKFYHVTLNGNTVTKRWGRVGAAGATSTENTGRVGYERAIKQKTKKGYKPVPVMDTGVQVKNPQQLHLEEVAKTYLAATPGDARITDLITRLVKANQHQIMEQSGGLITVTDTGAVRTALGIVTLDAVRQARRLLTQLTTMKTGDKNRVLEEYLSLIPQKVGSRRGWQDDFYTNEAFQKQSNFLDQLEGAVQLYENTKKADTTGKNDDLDLDKYSDLFRMKLSVLDNNSAEFKRINAKFESTRNRIHQSRNMKLRNVYIVEDEKGKPAFEAAEKAYGNVKELWHGTSVGNVLSILTKGFFVPKASDGIRIAGRMFGDGIYFSDQSTKSLNYASGYWHGTRNRDNCFMFLNDVVMGHEFRPTRWDSNSVRHSRKGVGRSGKPYQSIYVKGGTCGVVNNEMIVWNTDQIAIRYLCEFSE